MASDPCRAAIRAALGDATADLDDAAIDRVAAAGRERARRARVRGGADPAAALAALDGEAATLRASRAQDARRAALDALSAAERRAHLARFLDGDAADPALGAASLVNQVNDRRARGRASAEIAADGAENLSVGRLLRQLNRDGVADVWEARDGDGTLEAEIARELAARNTPGAARGTGAAAKIAAAVQSVRDELIARARRAGIDIGDFEGFVTTMSWRADKLAVLGRQRFVAEMTARLDWARAYDGELAQASGADRTDALARTFDALVTGVRLDGPGGGVRLGGENLADRLSHARVLVFKDAEGQLAMMRLAGADSLREAALSGVGQLARQVALVETLGSNPRAALAADNRWALERLRRDGKLALARSFNDALGTDGLTDAQRVRLAVVDGSAGRTANVTLATVAELNATLTRVGSLGATVLRSLPDVAAVSAQQAGIGRSFLRSNLETMARLFVGRSAAERAEIAGMLGVGVDTLRGGVLRDQLAGDAPMATRMQRGLSRMNDIFFRVNGQRWWQGKIEHAAAMMTSHQLARQTDRAFDALDDGLRDALGRGGIAARDWDLIRAAPKTDLNGRAILSADALRNLPDAAIAAAYDVSSGTGIARARDALEAKFAAFWADQIAGAAVVPGARTRGVITAGQSRGSWGGEIRRAVTQFLAYPIAYQDQVLGRIYGSDVPLGRKIGLVTSVTIAATLYGYLSETLVDITRGKEPLDAIEAARKALDGEPRQLANIVGRSMAVGGGLGLAGDFLFAEVNRFGTGPIESAAGPTIGKLSQAMNLLVGAAGKAARDDLKANTAAAEAARLLYSYVPGNNLFYTKIAFDYLFWFQLQESLSPGYLRKMERRLEKDLGQRYLVPPSVAIPRGGGDQLFEGVR